MKALKTLTLVALFIVFVVVGGVFALGKGIEKTFLDMSFYANLAEETNVAPALVGNILGGVEGQAESELQRLPAENRQQLRNVLRDSFSQALNEEWAEETFLMVVDDVLSYLKGEQEGLTAVIVLDEKKAAIQSSLQAEAREGVRAEAERQIQQRSDIPPGMEEQVRSQVESEMNSQINTAIAGMMSQVPDRISLAQLLENQEDSEEIKAMVARFQQVYSQFDLVFYLTLIILAALMLALAGLFGGLKWVGSGMMASGGAVFLFLVILKPSLPVLFNENNLDVNINRATLGSIANPFFSEMYTIALTYAGVGLLLLLIGIFSKKFKEQDL